MNVACPLCCGPMALETVRLDPHEPPEQMLVCDCGHREPAAADIEARDEARPKLPGF